MNKTLVTVISVLSASCLIGFYLWVSHNRYTIVIVDGDLTYEIDKKTGQTWVLDGVEKDPHYVISDKESEEIPRDTVQKITGRAKISDKYLSGSLYNGSNWIVTKCVFGLYALGENGNELWRQEYAEEMCIRPLSSKSFVVEITGGDAKGAQWSVVRVFGYKE